MNANVLIRTGLLLAWVAAFQPSWAQNHVSGEAIVMFRPGFDADYLVRQSPAWTHKKALSPELRIHLFSFDTLTIPENEVLARLSRLPGVEMAQFNHHITLRRPAFIPNDPQFAQQWSLNNTGQAGGSPDADIDGAEAWDLETGGANPLGDSIVAAVVDGGMDLSHPEVPLWKNRLEVPGNGMDDDGNGYIDDYDGWNAYQSNGQVPNDLHGTHVAGIVSARGDNLTGVAGVGWHTLVMPVAGASGNEATAVEAYAYVLQQRRRYNETGGKEGAFVVVTNSSFGVDFGQPAQFPIWCAIYDSLGAEGVLNAGATMNVGANVEISGDIPTACPSDFMIGVTNTTRRDQRNSSAAYGVLSVDLGAPGTDILSTVPGGGTGFLTGTSMATPHVAGVLALMYAHACSSLAWLTRTDPEGAALLMRQLLLQSVDTLLGFELELATGGRLNTRRALEAVDAWCASQPPQCLPPHGQKLASAAADSAELTWEAVAPVTLARIRPAGSTVWQTFSADSTLIFNGLARCQTYELSLASVCSPGDTSFYSPAWPFQTSGCCKPPQVIFADSQTDSSARLYWQRPQDTDSFTIRVIRLADGNILFSQNTSDTTVLVTSLSACEGYEIRVFSRCDSIDSPLFASFTWNTSGCGLCEDPGYCGAKGDQSIDEWIAGVEIGPITRISGPDGGYANSLFPPVELLADTVYDLTLTPGFSGFSFDENWQVWLDVNGDTLFQPEERLFVSTLPSEGPVSGQIRIPAVDSVRRVRMRVMMNFAGFGGNTFPAACDTFSFGEVEDFCVQIVPHESPCLPPQEFFVTSVPDSQATRLRWTPYFKADAYLVSLRTDPNGPWSFVPVTQNRLLITGLPPCQPLEWRVASLCGGDTSTFSDTIQVWSFGCGPCFDKTYCGTRGLGGAFIQKMIWEGVRYFHPVENGYFDHRNADPVEWDGVSPIPFTLFGGVSGQWAGAFWRIWGDLNGDGDFTDPDELLFDPGLVAEDSVQGELTLPRNLPLQLTRLRITLQRGQSPFPCGVFTDGEAEDICLRISRPESVDAVSESGITVYPVPFSDQLQVAWDRPLTGATLRLFDMQGRLAASGPGAPEGLDTRHVGKGMYVLWIDTANGRYWAKAMK